MDAAGPGLFACLIMPSPRVALAGRGQLGVSTIRKRAAAESIFW